MLCSRLFLETHIVEFFRETPLIVGTACQPVVVPDSRCRMQSLELGIGQWQRFADRRVSFQGLPSPLDQCSMRRLDLPLRLPRAGSSHCRTEGIELVLVPGLGEK